MLSLLSRYLVLSFEDLVTLQTPTEPWSHCQNDYAPQALPPCTSRRTMNGAQIFDQLARNVSGVRGNASSRGPLGISCDHTKTFPLTAGFRYKSCHLEQSASKRVHSLEHISPALFASLRLVASLKSGGLPYHTSIAHEKPVHRFAAPPHSPGSMMARRFAASLVGETLCSGRAVLDAMLATVPWLSLL